MVSDVLLFVGYAEIQKGNNPEVLCKTEMPSPLFIEVLEEPVPVVATHSHSSGEVRSALDLSSLQSARIGCLQLETALRLHHPVQLLRNQMEIVISAKDVKGRFRFTFSSGEATAFLIVGCW